MPRENPGTDSSQPKKSVFDHPDLVNASLEEKVGYAAKLVGIKGALWDNELLRIPASRNNPTLMKKFARFCKQETIPLHDITDKIDSGNPLPMYFYFEIKNTDEQ